MMTLFTDAYMRHSDPMWWSLLPSDSGTFYHVDRNPKDDLLCGTELAIYYSFKNDAVAVNRFNNHKNLCNVNLFDDLFIKIYISDNWYDSAEVAKGRITCPLTQTRKEPAYNIISCMIYAYQTTPCIAKTLGMTLMTISVDRRIFAFCPVDSRQEHTQNGSLFIWTILAYQRKG